MPNVGSTISPPAASAIVRYVGSGNEQHIKLERIGACVICVHGVASGKGAYDTFAAMLKTRQPRTGPSLPYTVAVPFTYGRVDLKQAAGTIGTYAKATNRDSLLWWPYGIAREVIDVLPDKWVLPTQMTQLSRRSWQGARELKELVGSLQGLLGDVPITILSHSNGTAVTLAALQEGMTIRHWILMGSCLNQDAVAKGTNETNFTLAASRVTGRVLNCASLSDDTAWLRGGIGHFGLPKVRQHSPAMIGTGGARFNIRGQSPSNLYELIVERTSHFVFSKIGVKVHLEYSGWWDMEWLTNASLHRSWVPHPVDVWEMLGSCEKPRLLSDYTWGEFYRLNSLYCSER